MNRTFLIAAVAGAVALGGAQGAADTLTSRGTSSSSAVLTPLAVHCRTGAAPIVTAAVAGKAGRKVAFILYVNNAVAHRGTLTANRSGVFSVSAPVVDRHRNSVQLRLVSRVAIKSSVTPTCTKPPTSARLRGSSSSFALNRNSNGSVTRWNPCDGDIHVRINATRGGTGALADARTALAALGRASGLHLVYDGTTTFVPRRSNSASQPASLVIAWAPPGTAAGASDYFGAGAVGEGGWRSSGSSTNGGATWNWKIVQGFVVLDPGAHVTPGFGSGVTRGALLLHELAHAAGLRHTSDGSQVMYPVLRSQSYASYGAGDLAGLRAVGAGKGCTVAS